MGDLTSRKSSGVNRLIGAENSTSEETNFAAVDSFQDLHTKDTPVTQGAYTNITVGTSAIELKVGSSKLDGRKIVCVQPKGRKVYYGYDSSVTTSTGTEVFKNQTLYIPVGPDQEIWLIGSQSGIDVRISEI